MATVDHRLGSARIAIASVFATNGMILAAWVSRIPALKEKLAASDGAFGLTLLSAAVGALLAMPITGILVARYGSRRIVLLGGTVLCLILPLLALATNLFELAGALFLLGIANGTVDVAQNAQAAEIEAGYRKSIMSSFHGLFSVGGFVGAGIGGFMAAHAISPVLHFAGIAAMALVIFVVSMRFLLSDATKSEGVAFALPNRALLGLGVVAFCVLLTEGAMSDWTAIYLKETLGTSEGFAAAGYAAFSLAMALGRFAGDWLSDRFSAARLIRLGGGLAAIGLGGALLFGQPWAALIGFGCVGAGTSFVFPLLLSAAARSPDMAPSQSIAAVATAGYTGFLVGPPAIGLTSEYIQLPGALTLVVLACALVVLLGGVARSSQQQRTTLSTASKV